MNQSTKDEVEVKFHEAKGKVKEKVGQVTNNPDLEAEGKAEQNVGKTEIKTGQIDPEHEEIACLAYQDWQQRGCPIGTPEEDWFRAEEEIKQHLCETSKKTVATSDSSETSKQADR
jgi:uncharacterized protein YjbJ (UPF0337 family)